MLCWLAIRGGLKEPKVEGVVLFITVKFESFDAAETAEGRSVLFSV